MKKTKKILSNPHSKYLYNNDEKKAIAKAKNEEKLQFFYRNREREEGTITIEADGKLLMTISSKLIFLLVRNQELRHSPFASSTCELKINHISDGTGIK